MKDISIDSDYIGGPKVMLRCMNRFRVRFPAGPILEINCRNLVLVWYSERILLLWYWAQVVGAVFRHITYLVYLVKIEPKLLITSLHNRLQLIVNILTLLDSTIAVGRDYISPLSMILTYLSCLTYIQSIFSYMLFYSSHYAPQPF